MNVTFEKSIPSPPRLNFLSNGGIMVLFEPTELPLMPFEVSCFNENLDQNQNPFQKMERVLRVDKDKQLF